MDYNEFLQAAVNHQSLLNIANIESIFSMIDSNNDGLISLQELMAIFSSKSASSYPGESKCFFDTIMKEVDLNLDNIITFEEFNGALTNILMDQLLGCDRE